MEEGRVGQVGWLVGWAAALAAMAGRAAAVEERASRVEGRVVQEERAAPGWTAAAPMVAVAVELGSLLAARARAAGLAAMVAMADEVVAMVVDSLYRSRGYRQVAARRQIVSIGWLSPRRPSNRRRRTRRPRRP